MAINKLKSQNDALIILNTELKRKILELNVELEIANALTLDLQKTLKNGECDIREMNKILETVTAIILKFKQKK